jgi:hypothetical protein
MEELPAQQLHYGRRQPILVPNLPKITRPQQGILDVSLTDHARASFSGVGGLGGLHRHAWRCNPPPQHLTLGIMLG